MQVLTGVIIAWVLPPLLGAIIGYVTNAIAIRMLFRPLTEKRVFGVRIPLTPGLIPRERGDLAESMARMVSTELLTEEAVRRQIHAPSFEQSVRENIGAITSSMLDTKLARIGRRFEPKAGEPSTGDGAPEASGDGMFGPVGGLLATAFGGFTRSASFALLARDLVAYLVDELAARPISSVLGANQTVDSLLGGLLSRLSSEHGRAEIRDRVASWIGGQFETNVPLASIFTDDDVEAVARFVDSIYPSLIKFFTRWLRSDSTRRELAVRGRFLVQDIVDRLNGFQRFIITAAQYQRTLDENMPGIIKDAIESIEEAGMDPESRTRIVEVIRRELGTMRGRGLADVAEKQRESIERTAGALAERAVGVLSGPEFRQGLLEALAGSENGERRTVGGLLESLFALEGQSPGRFVARLIFPSEAPQTPGASGAEPSAGAGGAGGPSATIGSGVASAVTGFFKGFLDDHGEMRIGELLGMDSDAKASFDEALASMLIATVDARIPQILESIDIHDLVVSKINGLNIEDVESLLLRVIEKHLRWINIFGAMLGALIGLFQDLLRALNLG